jgi:hypothetical protein
LTATEVNFSWAAAHRLTQLDYLHLDWLEEHVGVMDVYENGELKTWALTIVNGKLIFSFHDPQKAILFKLTWA